MLTPIQSKIKKITFGLMAAAVLSAAALFTPHTPISKQAAAAGNTPISVSPGNGTYTVGDSFTVTIREDSGSETVNGVQVYLKYDTNVLKATAVSSSGSPFSSGPGASIDTSAGKVTFTHSTTDSPLTSSQLIGTVTLQVTGTSSGSSLTIDQTSAIVNPYTGNDTWNHSTSPVATYTLQAKATTGGGSTGGGGTSTGGGGSTSTGGGSSGSSSSTSTKSSGTSSGSSNKSSSGGSSSSGSSNNSPTPLATTTLPDGSTQEVEDTGNYVAIKVTDSKNKPIEGAIVTLDGKTSKTTKTGVASFIGVPEGSYNVKVTVKGKTQSQKFSVSKQSSSNQQLQSFNVKFTQKSSPWTVYLIVLLVIVGLGAAGFVLPRRNKFHPPTGSGGGATAPTETIVVGDNSKSTDPDPTHVGQIIKPTIQSETKEDVK